jgi:alginate O-acetyltransferase complex protein AlgI
MIGQVTTMVLIGLWHGITWNFAIWGLWHGIGLFIHNRWVNILRSPSKRQSFDRLPSAISQGLALLITFHFTALGWVWFALPDLSLSVDVLRTLFGISG